MKPKSKLAIQAMKGALREFGFSDKELFEAAFHLTDWIEDLESFVEFLENPKQHTNDEIQTVLIAFVIHAPSHLQKAAQIILEEPKSVRKPNVARELKRDEQKRPRRSRGRI